MTDTTPAFDPTDLQALLIDVAGHLFKQGEQSKNEVGNCAYRGRPLARFPHTGLSCAIGHLISDEDYRRSMEGCGVVTLLRMEPKFTGTSIARLRAIAEHRGGLYIMSDLQNVHDTDSIWRTTATMRNQLLRIAERYEIDTPRVREALAVLRFEGR